MFEVRRRFKNVFRKKPVDRIAKKGPIFSLGGGGGGGGSSTNGGGTTVSTISAKGKEPARGPFPIIGRNSMYTSGSSQV
jgi:hypothetical protein